MLCGWKEKLWIVQNESLFCHNVDILNTFSILAVIKVLMIMTLFWFKYSMKCAENSAFSRFASRKKKAVFHEYENLRHEAFTLLSDRSPAFITRKWLRVEYICHFIVLFPNFQNYNRHTFWRKHLSYLDSKY